MTLMIIVAAAAAVYGLCFLLRCATHALPIFSGLTIAAHLGAQSLLFAALAGIASGIAVHCLGHWLTRGRVPASVKICVLLSFPGAATAAGFQIGVALTEIAGIDLAWQPRLSLMTALLAGCCSWRGLVGPGQPSRTQVLPNGG
jgi:hypothetical protein